MSVRLYVGNLPKQPIERQDLQTLFADAGDSVSTKVIKDRKTGKCRGFAFVTVPSDEIADQFIEKYNGLSFMDTTLKIEKAMPRTNVKGKANQETPGGEETESQQPRLEAAEPAPKPKKQKAPKRNNRRQENNSTYETESFQVDPRWAGALSELKERLATQAGNLN